MPGFVKTPKDEARWSKAKKAAGKSVPEGTESYWKLANYIFHKSEGSKESLELAEDIKKSLSFGLTKKGTSIPSGTKMPKAKKQADGFGKPSLFFKAEEFEHIKHPTLCKIRDLLKAHRVKNKN